MTTDGAVCNRAKRGRVFQQDTLHSLKHDLANIINKTDQTDEINMKLNFNPALSYDNDNINHCLHSHQPTLSKQNFVK